MVAGPDTPRRPDRPARVGYVLKQYPRLSETFVLNEIIGVESEGVDVSIFSLRPADEGRFHPDLAKVRGRVCYLSTSVDRAALVDTVGWLPNASTDGLARAVAFVDRLPAERRARLLVQGVELARRASAEGLGHLHAHFLTVAAHTVHIAHLLTGIDYSVTAHAKDIYRTGIDWSIAATVADAARAIVTVCDANKSHLEAKLPNARIVRIYNGLGPQPDPADWSERQPNLLLGVGRLVPKKGFDLLIDAVSELRAGGSDIECVIVGDGELRAELAARIDELGLADAVTMVGAATQDVVQKWMREAALLVASCVVGPDGNQDALPTVLVEALGAGLPAISTAVAGIPEIISDGRQGLIVEPEPDSIAAACQSLLDDRERWTAMSHAGPIRLAQVFDRATTAKELVSVFVEPTTPARVA